MIALLLLLAQQQAPDTTGYANPALRTLIARAAAVNAAPPADLRGFTARYESEVALAKALPDRVEGSSTIEQTAGEFTWVVGRGYGQHEEGYRVVTTGVPLPGSAALTNGWIIPTLAGPTWDVFGANSGADTQTGQDSTGTSAAWSPLGPDRDTYYRFEGGDTLTMVFPDGESVEVIRIKVWPRESPAARTKVFRGDLYLDPATGVLRRIRGQFLSIGGPPPSKRAQRLNSIALNAAVADIVTAEIPGAGWVPTYQRIELEVLIPLTTESWSTLRVVTDLRDVRPALATPATAMPLTPGRSVVSKDSLGQYDEWWARPDQRINDVELTDLFDVGPLRFRPVGPPIYMWRAATTLNVLRFNRVEGLYLGVGGTLFLRDAMPGLELQAIAGYAIWPGLPRGGLIATLERGKWLMSARAMRDLDLATKFADPLDYNRGLRALFQQDNYDYVDRLTAGVGLERYFSASGPGSVSLDLDWVKDRTTVAELNYGPLGQSYTINPNVDPYEYPRVRLALDWHPQISSHFTQAGLGLSASYEAGWGDLPYQRVQGMVTGRANWQSFAFTLVGYAGYTQSDSLPTQQLFLIGGSGTMPGYDYDQFGGNVAVLGRAMVAAPLPLLQAPLTVKGATIPPIAPNLSFRLYWGYTDTTSTAAGNQLNNVGTQVVDGLTVPFSVVSGSKRWTSEVRLSLFGTLLGFGLAIPLEQGSTPTFTFSFAQSF